MFAQLQLAQRISQISGVAQVFIGGQQKPAIRIQVDPAKLVAKNLSLEDVRTLYGLTSIVPPALAKPWLMGSVMAAWIVVPLGLASWRFKP